MLKKKFDALKPFAVDVDGNVHRSWTYRDALAWAGCYGVGFGSVYITRFGRVVGMRF